MEARPCPIVDFFNGTKQMLVPLFQRSYEWGPREWDALWEDILEQYERSAEEVIASHFTGAIVTAPAKSVPIGVSKFLVIDGQQRLTTFAILICAIRSLLPEGQKSRKLTSLLVNEHDEGMDYFKLLPTQPDRPALAALINGSDSEPSRFHEAFASFHKKLAGNDSDGIPVDLDRIIDTVQNRITVVAIHLGEADDPYLIFESLNAKGAPLTQADLIRNYLLLRLHSNEQQKAYEQAWLPMQKLLPNENLTEFMRQYLMLSGEEVGKSSIYSALKKRLASVSDASVFTELEFMKQASATYAEIIGLQTSKDPKISVALGRLRRWDVSTANTFILKLLEHYRQAKVELDEVVSCLATVESFVVRRAICGVPSNQLKRIFLAVTKEMPSTEISAWLTNNLALGASGRRWPKNEELKENLFKYRAYAQPIDRCKFILETIERSYGHKEPAQFEKSTIEHIMPQTLTESWSTALAPNAKETHERWLDLLGNLTLSGYNSELYNDPFEMKRELFQTSNFEMNKWLASQNNWTSDQMKDRTNVLFDKMKDIWSHPAVDS